MYSLDFYKKRKKEMHLTNEMISELSGLPKRTIEDFFSGKTKDPRASTLQAIERALGLSEEGYKDTMPFEVTPTEEELITKFRNLSDENKQLFLLLMNKIK